MGYRLLTQARWAGRHLRSVNAFKALLEMAHTAHDDDDPPLYWGRWDRLAIALGFSVPGEPTPDAIARKQPQALRAQGQRKTALNAVSAATKALVDHGLIRRAEAAAPGRTTQWELCLGLVSDGPEKSGTDTAGLGTPNGPEKSGTERSREPRENGPEKSGLTVPETPGPEEQRGSTTNKTPRTSNRRPPQPQTAGAEHNDGETQIDHPAGTHPFHPPRRGHGPCRLCGDSKSSPRHAPKVRTA